MVAVVAAGCGSSGSDTNVSGEPSGEQGREVEEITPFELGARAAETGDPAGALESFGVPTSELPVSELEEASVRYANGLEALYSDHPSAATFLEESGGSLDAAPAFIDAYPEFVEDYGSFILEFSDFISMNQLPITPRSTVPPLPTDEDE